MNKNKALPLVEKSASPKDAAAFLEHFLINELGKLINKDGQLFLKFLPLIVGIEFLGACYDDHPFYKQNESKKRFKKGISLMGDKYTIFDGSQKQKYPCLYEDFRCPMLHQFRTNQDKFRLTAVQFDLETEKIKNYHLEIYEGVYIIVLEELYKHFVETVKGTISDRKSGKLKVEKLKESHVVIRDMGILHTT